MLFRIKSPPGGGNATARTCADTKEVWRIDGPAAPRGRVTAFRIADKSSVAHATNTNSLTGAFPITQSLPTFEWGKLPTAAPLSGPKITAAFA